MKHDHNAFEISFPKREGLCTNGVDPTIILTHKATGVQVRASEGSQRRSLIKCYNMIEDILEEMGQD